VDVSPATLAPRTNVWHVSFSDGYEVSVIYFRSGYTPKDYPTEAEWAARLTIERSRAIKCPNVAYQLAGLKKIQQVLADPGVVEQFMPAEAAQLRESFAGLYSLDPPQVQQTISRLLTNIEGHVMKPQREVRWNWVNNGYNIHW